MCKKVSSHFFVVIVDEVEEHQACFQFGGRLTFAVTNVAILLFLLFGSEEEFQTAMLVELNQPWLVVGINNEETEEIVNVLASAVETFDAISGDITQRKTQTVVDVHTVYFFKLS